MQPGVLRPWNLPFLHLDLFSPWGTCSVFPYFFLSLLKYSLLCMRVFLITAHTMLTQRAGPTQGSLLTHRSPYQVSPGGTVYRTFPTPWLEWKPHQDRDFIFPTHYHHAGVCRYDYGCKTTSKLFCAMLRRDDFHYPTFLTSDLPLEGSRSVDWHFITYGVIWRCNRLKFYFLMW